MMLRVWSVLLPLERSSLTFDGPLALDFQSLDCNIQQLASDFSFGRQWNMDYLLSLVYNKQLVGVSLKAHALQRNIVGGDQIGAFLAENLKRFCHKLLVRHTVLRFEGHKKRIRTRMANFPYYLRGGL